MCALGVNSQTCQLMHKQRGNTHHAEVATLPELEQDFWLHKAEQLGRPRTRLRCEVRGGHTERGAGQRLCQPDHSTGPDGAACPDLTSSSCG